MAESGRIVLKGKIPREGTRGHPSGEKRGGPDMKGIEEFPGFVTRFTEAALPFRNAKGWFLQGNGAQVAFIEFSDAADVPEHSHQEQWELVLSGRVCLRMEGEEKEFKAGDNFFIPAGVLHSAEVSAGYKAIIFFNEPDRYRAKWSESSPLTT
jgi:hypothetical protein